MENVFEIRDDQIDVQKIMEKIDKKIEEKKKAGVYDKYDLSQINNLEIEKITDDRDFLEYYLKVIKQTYDIDIGDFEIHSKGGLLGKPVVWLKKIIWRFMKFYTYRLFSQQKEFNAQITNALISLNQKLDKSLAEINKKLEK